MRVTVVVPDTLVCIDGDCINGIDMSTVPPLVRAMQWYEVYGDVESTDPETGLPINTTITSLDGYWDVIAQWEEKKHPLIPPE